MPEIPFRISEAENNQEWNYGCYLSPVISNKHRPNSSRHLKSNHTRLNTVLCLECSNSFEKKIFLTLSKIFSKKFDFARDCFSLLSKFASGWISEIRENKNCLSNTGSFFSAAVSFVFKNSNFNPLKKHPDWMSLCASRKHYFSDLSEEPKLWYFNTIFVHVLIHSIYITHRYLEIFERLEVWKK